ncbi:two-pore potassium channel 1-like [Aristolochia californica]|uniref:two-pore potassium channel 1-like n=1 Tax=Aristolochia californica TaxID=171875 RepID=UPI0035E20264
MAHDGAKVPLLSCLEDPASPSKQKHKTSNMMRRYRRCKSAPAKENIIVEKNQGGLSSLVSQNILQKLHPSLRQVTLALAMYLGVGTLCFYLVRKQVSGHKTNGVIDAIYFCIVTMTTVGYGDLAPNSVATKLLACAFVFSGVALVGMILSKAADYLVEKQELLFVKAVNIRRQVGATEIVKELEMNRVKYKFLMVTIALLILIAVGTIFLFEVENLNLVDSFYCVCSTITTLGYGDMSFSTQGGRIFAIFWILASTICVAQFFLYMAELYTESRQQSLAKWVLTRRMTSVDLEAADLDDDGVVSAAEFILFKLKEMGKISQEDITPVLEEFDGLDVDQSGTLTASDLLLAQSAPLGS